MAERFKQRFASVDSISAIKVIYDDGDLRIEGYDRQGKRLCELRFPDMLLVRVTDEGTRLALLRDLEMEPARGLVVTDERSELIPWINAETLGTRGGLPSARHFLVFAAQEIVDVVAVSEPELVLDDPE